MPKDYDVQSLLDYYEITPISQSTDIGGRMQRQISREANEKFLDANTPIVQGAKSPVGIMERLAMAFGNQQGSKEYLKGKGYDAESRGSDLFVIKEGKAYPVDPSSFELADIAEVAPDVLSGVLEELAGLSAASGATMTSGPASVVAAPAAYAAGTSGAAGGLQYIRNALGEKLGTFKGDLRENVPQSAGFTALMSLLLPGVGRLGKHAAIEASKKALEKQVPEKIFASGTGLGKMFAEEPEKIAMLMKRGTAGKTEPLRDFAKQMRNLTEDELQEVLKNAKGIKRSEVEKIISGAKSGTDISKEKQLNDRIKELQENVKEMTGKPIYRQVKKETPVPLTRLEELAQVRPKYKAEKVWEKVDELLSAAEINKQKRTLYRDAYKTTGGLKAGAVQDINSKVASKLKTLIEDAAKQTGKSTENKVKKINQILDAYSKLEKSLSKKIEKDAARPVISGTDTIMAASAAISPKMLAVLGGKKAIQNIDKTALSTHGANWLKKNLPKIEAASKAPGKLQILMDLLTQIGTEYGKSVSLRRSGGDEEI